MPDRSSVTSQSLAAALDMLRRHPIAGVRYFYLGDADSWDGGEDHQPTMGVEFIVDGGVVLASWGDAFGHFGLELQLASGDEVFENGPRAVDVSNHLWWQPFLGRRVDVDDIWRTDITEEGGRTPLALGLSTGEKRLWVVAAEKEADGSFWLGADELLVSRDDVWNGERSAGS